MIQRIQSIYYLLAILTLAIPLAGMEIFSLSSKEVVRSVTLYGTETEMLVDQPVVKQLSVPNLPLYLGNLVLIGLIVLIILSYKRLKRQMMLGRFTLAVYALTLLGLCMVGYFFTQWLLAFQTSLMPGIGFYVMAVGILFLMMGNRGVKKDKKLLDSVDRIR